MTTPVCVLAMGCLCAAHARGAPARAKCESGPGAWHPRCSPKCPGWIVAHVDDSRGVTLQACDECNNLRRDACLPCMTDDDVASLPPARRALADALLGTARVRRCRSRRDLARARAAALEAHDLRCALVDVLAWTDHNPTSDRDARHKIANRARAALGMEGEW